MERSTRYRSRCSQSGDDVAEGGDPANPLPGLIDTITLQPVEVPAVSIYGHVLNAATWKVRPHALGVQGCVCLCV